MLTENPKDKEPAPPTRPDPLEKLFLKASIAIGAILEESHDGLVSERRKMFPDTRF